MKIVCLGDSITFGYGVPRSKCYVSLTQEKTGHTLVNAGVNGDTTAGMLARLHADALCEKSDALLLLGGTNDFLNGADAGTVQSNVAAILQQARSLGISVLLGTPPPVYPALLPQAWRAVCAFCAPESERQAFMHWQRAFAEGFSVVLVDFYGALRPLADADPRAIFPDGLHPGTEGHRVMAECLTEALGVPRI